MNIYTCIENSIIPNAAENDKPYTVISLAGDAQVYDFIFPYLLNDNINLLDKVKAIYNKGGLSAISVGKNSYTTPTVIAKYIMQLIDFTKVNDLIVINVHDCAENDRGAFLVDLERSALAEPEAIEVVVEALNILKENKSPLLFDPTDMRIDLAGTNINFYIKFMEGF